MIPSRIVTSVARTSWFSGLGPSQARWCRCLESFPSSTWELRSDSSSWSLWHCLRILSWILPLRLDGRFSFQGYHYTLCSHGPPVASFSEVEAVMRMKILVSPALSWVLYCYWRHDFQGFFFSSSSAHIGSLLTLKRNPICPSWSNVFSRDVYSLDLYPQECLFPLFYILRAPTGGTSSRLQSSVYSGSILSSRVQYLEFKSPFYLNLLMFFRWVFICSRLDPSVGDSFTNVEGVNNLLNSSYTAWNFLAVTADFFISGLLLSDEIEGETITACPCWNQSVRYSFPSSDWNEPLVADGDIDNNHDINHAGGSGFNSSLRRPFWTLLRYVLLRPPTLNDGLDSITVTKPTKVMVALTLFLEMFFSDASSF